MEPHLTDTALEALAHGRDALATPDDRAHLAGCAACAAALASARARSLDLGPALATASPEAPDFDAMIARALAAAPAAPAPAAPAPAAPAPAAPAPAVPALLLTALPSRRSLLAGAAAALGLLALALWFGTRETSALPRAFGAVRDAAAVLASLFRIAFTAPGGPAAAALVGLVLFGALALGVHRLAGGVASAPSREVYSS